MSLYSSMVVSCHYLVRRYNCSLKDLILRLINTCYRIVWGVRIHIFSIKVFFYNFSCQNACRRMYEFIYITDIMLSYPENHVPQI